MDHALPEGHNYLTRVNPERRWLLLRLEILKRAVQEGELLQSKESWTLQDKHLKMLLPQKQEGLKRTRRKSLGPVWRKVEDVQKFIGSTASGKYAELDSARARFDTELQVRRGGSDAAIDVSHIIDQNAAPMNRSEERLMGALADLNEFVLHMNAVVTRFGEIESTRAAYESARTGMLGAYSGASKDAESEKQLLTEHFTQQAGMKLGQLSGLLRTPGVRIAFKLEARPVLDDILALYNTLSESVEYNDEAIEGALEMCSRFVGSPIDFRPRIEDGLTEVMIERAGEIFDAVLAKGIDWSQEGLWRIPGAAGEVSEAFNLYITAEDQMEGLLNHIDDMDAKTALSLVMKIVRDDLTRRDGVDISDNDLSSLVSMLVATVEAEGNKMPLANLVTSFPYASELMI